MARITVEDCLDNVSNRFELVMLATRRARQLARTGVEPLIPWENDKVTVVALREIALGLVNEETIRQAAKAREQAAEAGAQAAEAGAQITKVSEQVAEVSEQIAKVGEQAAEVGEHAAKVDEQAAETGEDEQGSVNVGIEEGKTD